MIRLTGLLPDTTRVVLERWVREIEDRLQRVERLVERPKYIGHNPSTIGPGEYAHVNALSATTILVRKPGLVDLWNVAEVRHTNTTSLTLQAVGCSINGVADGTVVSTSVEVIRLQAVPGDGAQEWVTL